MALALPTTAKPQSLIGGYNLFPVQGSHHADASAFSPLGVQTSALSSLEVRAANSRLPCEKTHTADCVRTSAPLCRGNRLNAAKAVERVKIGSAVQGEPALQLGIKTS